MIQIIRLSDALKQIVEAAERVLAAEATEGGMLEGVASVVISERSRPRPELPALYVFMDTAATGTPAMGLRETWRVPLVVVALVRESEEPSEGYLAAMDYAANARTVLLRPDNRTLGLPFVNGLISTSFQPAYQTQVDNRNIYGAAATLGVTFTVYEGA